ncbi:hypothetical protein BGX34_010598 [Mortierella sp. NVP85]|nr:hypothetical protein BGX34_010598 [Mortierella sp. NVP85]
MLFGSVITSPRGDLTVQQALDLANVYLENASRAQDPVVALVLCHDTELSLHHARRVTKSAEDQAKQEGIAAAYAGLGSLLDSRGHRSEAQAMYKKAKKLGGNVTEPGRTTPSLRSNSIVPSIKGRPLSIMNTPDVSSLIGSSLIGSSKSQSKQRKDLALIPAQIFADNKPSPTIEFKPPEPDRRLNDTPQLACCLGLLQFPDDVLEPTARNWVQLTNDSEEQERLQVLATDVVRSFKRDELKDAKAIAEVIYLTPVLEKDDFRYLLKEFYTGIDQSVLLDVYQLEGLAQLLQGAASPGYLDADDLVKILGLISSRLRLTHDQSQLHPYQLTLTVSNILDAMADTKVKGLDLSELHEPLRSYLDRLKGSSDPYLVYQAAYAYQALQYVPDSETLWQATLRRTGNIAQGMSGLVSPVKGDLNGFIEGLGNIQQGLTSEVLQLSKSSYDGVTSLSQSGQIFMDCLKDGFDRKRAWYPALRGADSLIQDGQFAEFKRLVCEAPCRRDPAFQWGVCQRLGDLASNTTWDVDTRRGAIAFLGEMYRNDAVWGQQASVKQWIINILMQLSSMPGSEAQFIKALFQELETEGDTKKQNMYRACQGAGPGFYPLKVALPPPGSPSLLDRVQNRPDVESNLRQLRKQRLEERGNIVYIPLQAKASLQAPDDSRFPLMEEVRDSLNNDQRVFLLLGDSGSGKSTFCRQLECDLWEPYKKRTGVIPLYINLPAIDKPEHDLIAKHLRKADFTEPQIRELKFYRKFILICDGYDESRQIHNLYTSNRLNQPGEWNAQIVISCRSEYVGINYQDRFWPGDRNAQPEPSLYQEAVITSFSADQVQDYIEQYVSVHQSLWQTADYRRALELIPNLMDLMKNPLLMTLSLEVLPRMVNPGQHLSETRVSRMALYDHFVEDWLERSKKRLGESDLNPKARDAFESLSSEGFTQSGINFLKQLSIAIYKEQDGQPVLNYSRSKDEGSWKSGFFSRDEESQLLREAIPITRGGNHYQFIHGSLLEYGLSLAIYDPQDWRERSVSESVMTRRGSASSTMSFEVRRTAFETTPTAAQGPDFFSPLVWRNIVVEPSLLQFLVERVQQEPVFKRQLLAYIECSKADKKWRTAAANAITILIKAGVQFVEADLRGVRIPGADLSYGMFYSAQLQDADLRKTNLTGAWLQQADLNSALMKGTQFGELPFLKAEALVMSCAYSPDNKSLAVALYRGGVLVYTTKDWEKTGTLGGHSREVLGVVFSPEGDQIATCSEDATIRIWDTETKACRHILSGHTGGVTKIAYSPQGDLIASSSNDKTVKLWDVETAACRLTFTGHTEYVLGVAFSPKGNRIASSSADKTVRIWDIASGECYHVLNGHRHWVNGIAYSPRGHIIASVSMDTTVRLWNAETGAHRQTLTGHGGDVKAVAFSSKGDVLTTASADKTIRMWDVETGSCRQTFTGHTAAITSVVYSLKGDQIASSSVDQTVRLWDLEARSSCHMSNGHGDGVTSIIHSVTSGQIASSGKDGSIRLWDMETGTCRFVLKDRTACVPSIAYSPRGYQMVSGDHDGRVQLWNVETGERYRTLTGHSGQVNSVVYSPRGDVVASASDDKTIRLWNVEVGTCTQILTGHTERVVSAVFSPKGNRIATCSEDKTVCLWDVDTGVCCNTLSGHSNHLTSVVYSPQGGHLASTSDDGTVRLWNAETGACTHTLAGHRNSVRDVAYSPQGNLIASAGSDKTVRLWDAEAGTCRHTLDGHNGIVTRVAFSPRGDMVASGSDDMTVRLWDIESGQCRAVMRNPHGEVRNINWFATSEAHYLAVGCEDGSVWMWQVVGEGILSAVRLCWKSMDGKLAMANASIQDASGLSERNKQLLKQRGAEGEPLHRLREARKKLISMASVASELRMSWNRLSVSSPLASDFSFEQPEQRIKQANEPDSDS